MSKSPSVWISTSTASILIGRSLVLGTEAQFHMYFQMFYVLFYNLVKKVALKSDIFTCGRVGITRV